MSANNACRECGVASMGPRNCAHCGAMNCMTTPEVDTLRAEVERLREALRAIAEYQPREVVKDDFAYDRMVRGFQDAARAALAGAPSETRREQGRALAERLREALRDVAERQREACAEYLTHWTYDEHTLSRVRATPLVTEDE